MKKATGLQGRDKGGPYLSHILENSHPSQLFLDHPKVVNFVPKLGTISSMINLKEGACDPTVVLQSPPGRAGDLTVPMCVYACMCRGSDAGVPAR